MPILSVQNDHQRPPHAKFDRVGVLAVPLALRFHASALTCSLCCCSSGAECAADASAGPPPCASPDAHSIERNTVLSATQPGISDQ